MDNRKKITTWCHNFQCNTKELCSDDKPEEQLVTQNLLLCENDYLFFMLVMNSINRDNDTNFITESQLRVQWKEYNSSSAFNCYVLNCRNDMPCYPYLFNAFVTQYHIFNWGEKHPLHIPENFSYFFHTLFSSWKGKLCAPLNQRMTIIELWNNFKTEIENRLLISVSSDTDFYLTQAFNLKLFEVLFNVDTELIKEYIQKENDKFPSRSSLTTNFLDVTYTQIEQIISYCQQRILCPSLQKSIIYSFQKQLKEIYYTTEDFDNPGILVTLYAKTVKYSDYNDESIDIFKEQISACINKLKEFIAKNQAECSLTNSFIHGNEEIKITHLNPDCSLDEHKNVLNMHFEHFYSDLHGIIQSTKESLSEKIPNITLKRYYFQEIDSFFDFASTKWNSACKEHTTKLEYNDSLTNHDRRNEKMIRKNADSFYPIIEYCDIINERLLKICNTLRAKTTKEPAPTPAASKQQQIDSLCLQTRKLIDQYASLIGSLRTPFLDCSAESLFSYLSEQQYFDIDSTTNNK